LLPTLSDESQHIEGSSGGNGTVVCQATCRYTFFQPELGKKVTFFSSHGYESYELTKSTMELYASMRQTKEEDSNASQVAGRLLQHVMPHSLIFIDQEAPYGAATILANGVELRLFGVYNADYALLAVTNIQNFEERLSVEHPSVFWTHRFPPKDSAYLMLFTKRICARWFRWKSQDNLSSTAARFVALERLLYRDVP
jgi:hypothetical protein